MLPANFKSCISQCSLPFPMSFLILLLLAALSSTASSAVVPANFTGRLDAFITCMMSTYGPPARRPPELIIAVVANGQTLVAAGYGKDASGAPITAHTLMGIGSVSKAFTSTLVALLAAKGLLYPDGPIANLPRTTLRTHSDYIDRHATLRDLLTHNTGVSRGDYLALLYNGTEGPTASVDWRSFVSSRVRSLPPVVDFREYWRYNNFMVAAAAAVLQDVDGTRPWEDMLQDDLLSPLGMTDTISSTIQARLSGKAATPYTRGLTDAEPPRQLPADADDWADLVKPAGSIFSSATDMAQWIKLHTGHGPTTIPLPAEYLDYLHTAQVLIDLNSVFVTNDSLRSSVSLGYGYGWFEVDVQGHRLVTHTGALVGFWSQLDVWPLDDFGVFVSTPAVNFNLLTLLTQWVMLELLGMDNFVAGAYCSQGAEARGNAEEDDVSADDWAKVEAALRRDRLIREATDRLSPSHLPSAQSPSYTALLASAAQRTTALATPEQAAGVYADRRSGVWGSLQLSTTGNASWPLRMAWQSWVALLRPSEVDGRFWDALSVEPLVMVLLEPLGSRTVFINTSAAGTVYGVYVALDEPLRQ